jgi:hypothetical protein
MQLVRFLSAMVCLTFLAGVGGCASSKGAEDDDDEAAVQRAWNDPKNHIRPATNVPDDPSPDMVVAGEEGSLNAVDVEEAIHTHRGELLDCYKLGRRSAKNGYGRAMLRFFVDGKGEVVDVAILESTVGNGRIERCLADIAVGVHLPPPNGHKPTTFDYPIEFTARPVTAERQKRH